MKISGVYIDGFGVFHDQSVSGLDRNLLLFSGQNEAGKSTLLGFIRSVLFGFPRANSKDSLYLPVAGGEHGGYIDLVTQSGQRWSVSRKPGKGGGTIAVTGADGLVHDKTMLDQLLGGISYEAYRSIMAFGLSELQTMDTLSGEHIASAIYGAGLGTSMMAMPRALKQIRKRMDDLLKGRGGSKIINRLTGELDSLRKAIHEASLQTDRYDSAFDALSAVEKDVQSHREKLTDSRRRKQRFESLERLWPDWIAFRESRLALSELGPATETFPEDGLSILEALAEKQDRFRETLDALKKRLDQLSSRLSQLPVDEKILSRAQDIASLVENRNAYLENFRRRPMLAREEQSLQEKIIQRLSHLGNDWTEAAILDFNRSLFTRDTVRGHQSSLDSLEKKLAAVETLLADKKAVCHRATEARILAEKDVAAVGDPPPERDQESVQRLKQGRDRFLDALEEYKRLSKAHDEARSELSRLEEEFRKTGSGSKWPVVMLAGIGTIAAGVVAFFGYFEEAFMVMGGTLMVTWATWVHRKHQHQLHMNHKSRLRQEQLRADELLARCRHLESIKKEYFQFAKSSGAIDTGDIPEEALPVAVDRFFYVLSEEDKKRESLIQSRRRLDERKSDETTALKDLEKVAADQEEVKKSLLQEKSEWTEKCRALGFSHSLSPATALDALDVIEETVGLLQQRDRCKSEGSRMEAELAKYREKAGEVLSSVGWPIAEDNDLPPAMNELMTRLEESRGNKREKDTLERQLAGLLEEQAEAEELLLQTEEAARGLIETAGLQDESDFRKIGRIEQKRAELLSAARLAEGNMRRISGEVDISGLKEHLEPLSLADILSEKETAEEETRTLDGELSGFYARRAELKQALDTLSTSDDISRLRSREAVLLADLAENTREWSRHALAEYLIHQAREIFERKHQPSIIKEAGEIFSRMTGGRYRGVVSPLGENTIEAVDRNGGRIPPEHLSRGTAEQLYLSVRFSYIRHQAHNSDPLPVIMDDILVNFDPERARSAAGAIKNLSETHQVMVFTCHPETVDLLLEIDPALPVYGLSGGRILEPDQPKARKKSKTP